MRRRRATTDAVTDLASPPWLRSVLGALKDRQSIIVGCCPRRKGVESDGDRLRRPSGPLSGSSFLSAEAGEGRCLFHPRRELLFVDVVHGFEVDASGVLVHPDRRSWRYGREARAA